MMERRETQPQVLSWTLMDGFAAALLELRDNGQIVHFNRAWVELMDQPPAQRNLIDYVHREDRSLWRQALLELQRRPATTFSQRLRFVHPSGELRWLEVSLKRGPGGFYLVAGDVTAHKRREIARQHAGVDLSRAQQPRLDHGICQRRVLAPDRLPAGASGGQP